jgi:heme/copper-type cytochrome/quinol oxidase subunit 1
MYTTNHKRIAVNYFWFVIFAGICGMVLATIIRLELAYPGVGILAGDSLQYLSVVTAHAVIMVFFMIIPLLFGAFGNFLLPTQLGVHDVAFPRLNSAAFWFLPAGLIMLCQLVCLDRRYQRMNCFNIREVQALLKGRFFNDLVNSHDHHEFLNKTVIGLRFKTNNLDSIKPSMLLFYQYGIYSNLNTRSQSYTSSYSTSNNYVFFANDSVFNSMLSWFDTHALNNVTSFVYNFYLMFLNTLSLGTPAYNSNVYGKSTLFTSIHSLINFSKTELDRTFSNIMNLFNLNQPVWMSTNNIKDLFNNSIDNLMFGVMDNNMGFHKERLSLRPTTSHPEIKTDGSMFEFVFSSFYSMSSRSILVFVRGVLSTFESFTTRFASRFTEISDTSYSYNTVSSLALVFGNVINVLVSFFYNLINVLTLNLTAFSFTNKLVDLQMSLSYLMTLNTFFGLTDFSFGTWERLMSYVYSISFSSFNNRTATSSYTEDTNYTSKQWSSLDLNDKLMFSNQEISSNFRFQKFSNPVFRYDYKAGNYLTKDDIKAYPTLFTTISEITGGIRKASWFFSGTFLEVFNSNLNNYINYFSTTSSKNPDSHTSYISHTSGFFNFFFLLSDSSNFINMRWLAINSMDQKFYRMFTTSSMQQRIYGNWRQLKFTREAWRCKLLAARHQKTMYRRYVDEDSIFWSVERNAKDVLPGWAMITPFSARTRFTAIGKVDIGLMGVFLVLNSSIVSSANFLVTYRYLSTLNNRKMRDARSFFTEGIMVASWMMIAANPMLAIGILMLLSDRHWQTSFFDYSGGGDTVLFQHMFWFFGHPEVYVVMIPAFGFNNTILSFYLRKRVSARASLMYSIYTIAFLGFFVWGHHMYMVGLAHTTRMLFSTLTVMISVPAATKLMHWCVTLVNSSFWVELPFVFTLLFIFFFVSGGISGMAVAHTGMDVLFHDSYYVIGHFHVMFAGSAMFASFGAFYFYFPSIWGVKFSRIYGYLHVTYFALGQLMTVIPMFWLGYAGMPRRILDYPAALGGWHSIVSSGHLLSVAGLMAFFIMIFDSLRQGRAVTRNSFGISRFNTRLNFYLYEISRNRYIQRKGWFVSRFNKPNTLMLNSLNYNNNELLETTLYSYVLVRK